MTYEDRIWENYLLDEVYKQMSPNIEEIVISYAHFYDILGYGKLDLPRDLYHSFIQHNLTCLLKRHPHCGKLYANQAIELGQKDSTINCIITKLLGTCLEKFIGLQK